jgi:hypothetical protein
MLNTGIKMALMIMGAIALGAAIGSQLADKPANINKNFNDITNKSITDMSMKIMKKYTVTAKSNTNSTQINKVNIKTAGNMNCDISSNQTIKIVETTTQSLSNNDTVDITRTMNDTLNNKLKNESKQAASGLLPPGNVNETYNTIDNYSFTDLSTVMSTELQANVNKSINAWQQNGVFLDVGGDYTCKDGIRNIQNIDIASIINNTLTSAAVQKQVDDYTKKVTNDIVNKNDQVSKGFDPAAFLAMMIVSVLLMFILPAVVVFIFFKLVGNGVLSAPGKVFGTGPSLTPAARKKQIAIYVIVGIVVLLIISFLIVLAVGAGKAKKKVEDARKRDKDRKKAAEEADE